MVRSCSIRGRGVISTEFVFVLKICLMISLNFMFQFFDRVFKRKDQIIETKNEVGVLKGYMHIFVLESRKCI